VQQRHQKKNLNLLLGILNEKFKLPLQKLLGHLLILIPIDMGTSIIFKVCQWLVLVIYLKGGERHRLLDLRSETAKASQESLEIRHQPNSP
jgi:hypothetical protein